MAKQQYSNHTRYYPPHHFIFYPVVLFMCIICTRNYFRHPEAGNEWLMMLALSCVLGALSFMMRQHYALNNQNRMVRLEMRLRYYQLTQKRFEPFEQQLSLQQIAALRFAGDEELGPLIEKTLGENLQPDSIKKQVKDWQEDHMRV